MKVIEVIHLVIKLTFPLIGGGVGYYFYSPVGLFVGLVVGWVAAQIMCLITAIIAARFDS
jgi:hypothetical protein